MSKLHEEVQRFAAKAQTDFDDRAEGRLDFSVESLQIVEEMLAEASTYLDDLSTEAVEQLVTQFGCYVLEVARHQFGGTYSWLENRDQPVLVVGDLETHTAIGTWDKVRSRLSGDVGDNIPFFFEGFAERVRTPLNGTRSLYV